MYAKITKMPKCFLAMTALQIDPIYFKYRTDQNVSVTGGEEPPAMSDSFVKNARFGRFTYRSVAYSPHQGCS